MSIDNMHLSGWVGECVGGIDWRKSELFCFDGGGAATATLPAYIVSREDEGEREYIEKYIMPSLSERIRALL